MNLRRTLYRDIDPAMRKVWLVAGMLGDGELSCLFGPPGSGKSVIAGDLAAHIAGGLPWFGRRVAAGPVLYVAAERAALVKRRFAAIRKHHNLPDLPLAVLEGTIDLRSSGTVAKEIIGHAYDLREETGDAVRFIVVDTTSRALNGGDENSPKDMGAFVGNLGAIQAGTGAHLMVVHHPPVDGRQRLRGHSALLGAVDTTINVEKFATYRSATVDKQNDGEEGESISFTLKSVEIAPPADDQEATTAPVVIRTFTPASAVREAAPVRMPKSAHTALAALREAVASLGQRAPASMYIPADANVVTVAQWRDYAYRKGISDSEEARARQQAFKRAYDNLVGSNVVRVWNGNVWIP